METLSRNLRRRAKELGLSDAEVARRAGLSERRYGHYVAGSREPDFATFLRICEVLAVTPNDLLVPPLGERFARFGHIEVPDLCRYVQAVAPHDQDFVVELYRRVFQGGDFRRDQTTAMGDSWILPLTSNAAQDFHMAAFSLKEAYPDILRDYPLIGMRALAVTLRAIWETKERHGGRQEVFQLPIGDAQFPFQPDYSAAWAWDIDGDSRDDHSEMFRAFLAWAGQAPGVDIQQAPELILSETGMALAWRLLFEIGARRMDALAEKLWLPAISRTVLQCEDTRRSAIAFIAAAYLRQAPDQRREAEDEWLGWTFDGSSAPERTRLRLLGQLFAAIGVEKHGDRVRGSAFSGLVGCARLASGWSDPARHPDHEQDEHTNRNCHGGERDHVLIREPLNQFPYGHALPSMAETAIGLL